MFNDISIPMAAYETIITLLNIYIILVWIAPGRLRVKTAVVLSVITIAPFPIIILNPGLSDALLAVILPLPSLFCAAAPMFSVAGMKKRTILYISLTYIGFSTAMISPFAWLLSVFGWGSAGDSIPDILINLTLLLLCVFTARGKILRRAVSAFVVMSKYVLHLLGITFWVYSAFIALATSFFRKYESIPNIEALEFLSAALVLLISIMCPLMIAYSVANAVGKSQLAMMARQVKAQAEHYTASVKADRDMRIFRHDFRNLKIALAELLRARDFYGALRALEECEEPFNEYDALYNTGDPILDALLRDKQAHARESDTRICFEGAIPPDSLHPTAVCAIFGNAIDNALRACQETPDDAGKTIGVAAAVRNGFLYITVKNPVLSDIRITDNTLPTTKADRFAHGIGLLSIESAAKAHQGAMKISCAGRVFTLEVELDISNPAVEINFAAT